MIPVYLHGAGLETRTCGAKPERGVKERPPAHVQQRIRAAAEAKRERRRLARIRHHELTALGREAWRLGVHLADAYRVHREAVRGQRAAATFAYWAAFDAYYLASGALRAARGNPAGEP